MGNQIRTTLLLAVLTALILWIGQLFGGRQGMVIALIFAAGMNFVSYWYSDKIVLRMYHARKISSHEAADIYGMVQTLSRRAGLPMPEVYLIPQEAPNAFATGRDPAHAVIAVTQGLLDLMDREEVMGVLAHELAHVKHRDILIGSVAATMAGAIMMLASMARWAAIFGGGRNDDDDGGGGGMLGLLLMSILAPMAAMLIQMAISRSREYLADDSGAAFAGHPEGLARALEKLGACSARIPMAASPSTAHMFIVNPLSAGGMTRYFSTHPPLAERIARLRGTRPSGSPPDGTGRKMNAEAEAFWKRISG